MNFPRLVSEERFISKTKENILEFFVGIKPNFEDNNINNKKNEMQIEYYCDQTHSDESTINSTKKNAEQSRKTTKKKKGL